MAGLHLLKIVTVEVAIIHYPFLYEVLKIEKLEKKGNNGNENGEEKKLKNWGKKYNICTIEKPVILKINDRYKDILIEYKDILIEYKKYETKSGYFREFIFEIILDNAIIYFHKEILKKIKWNC